MRVVWTPEGRVNLLPRVRASQGFPSTDVGVGGDEGVERGAWNVVGGRGRGSARVGKEDASRTSPLGPIASRRRAFRRATCHPIRAPRPGQGVVLAYPRTYVLLYRRGFRASHRVAVDTGTSTQVHTFTLYLCTWKVYLPLTSARGTRYTTRVRGTRLRVRLTRYAIPFARGASAAYQECSDLSSADSPFAHKGSMVGKRLAIEAGSGLRGEWGRGAVPCPERADRKLVGWWGDAGVMLEDPPDGPRLDPSEESRLDAVD